MSTPEIFPYLFAGDVHLQKMRVEEKATYPVHRYAPSFNLYENDSVTATSSSGFWFSNAISTTS